MLEIIVIILSSTVIATVISSIINIVNTKKANKLEYISSERKQWREELRKIAEEINTSDLEELSLSITKLKVRINAYGITGTMNISKDNYIWYLLDMYDKQQISDENINEYKNLLIKCISMLLKRDWEKYKYEVNGFQDVFIEGFMFILIMLSYIYSIRAFFYDYIHAVMGICFTTIFFFVLYTLRCRLKRFSDDNMSKLEEITRLVFEKKRDKNKPKTLRREIAPVHVKDYISILLCLIIPTIVLYLLNSGDNFTFITQCVRNYIIVIFNFMIWKYIWSERINDAEAIDICYIEAVGKISEETYKLENIKF